MREGYRGGGTEFACYNTEFIFTRNNKRIYRLRLFLRRTYSDSGEDESFYNMMAAGASHPPYDKKSLACVKTELSYLKYVTCFYMKLQSDSRGRLSLQKS